SVSWGSVKWGWRMRKGTIVAALLGTAVALSGTAALAADVPKAPVRAAIPIVVPNPIIATNNQISLGAAISHLHYAEDEAPIGFLDGEDGWIPGFVASASVMGNHTATG